MTSNVVAKDGLITFVAGGFCFGLIQPLPNNDQSIDVFIPSDRPETDPQLLGRCDEIKRELNEIATRHPALFRKHFQLDP